jgi:hypothetical protein
MDPDHFEIRFLREPLGLEGFGGLGWGYPPVICGACASA